MAIATKKTTRKDVINPQPDEEQWRIDQDQVWDDAAGWQENQNKYVPGE